MSDHGRHFSSYEGHKERRTGKIRGFKDAQGFGRLDAGSRAGFISSRPPPPWTSVFHFWFLISVQCVALRILDLLIKTGWSVIFPVFC